MPDRVYRYACNIWTEAASPSAWRTTFLTNSMYYIHDYAFGILRTSWPIFIADFLDDIGVKNIALPETNNKYPDSFKGHEKWNVYEDDSQNNRS